MPASRRERAAKHEAVPGNRRSDARGRDAGRAAEWRTSRASHPNPGTAPPRRPRSRPHRGDTLAVEIGQVTGLAKTVDAEGADALATHTTKPGERGGTAIDDGDQTRMRRRSGARSDFDVRSLCVDRPEVQRDGAPGRPASMQQIGRSHVQQAQAWDVVGELLPGCAMASGAIAPVKTMAAPAPAAGGFSQ